MSFQPVEYEAWVDAMRGVRARYWNAGHLLGSASIELEFAGEGSSGAPLRVLVSGDIGPDAKLLQPDPEAPAGFDYVISESTYGDTDRPATTPEARRQRLAAEVRDAAAAKGALLIPAFAVERTQELIVDLIDLMERGEVPTAPIFLDSPLAIRATEVFRQHASSLDPDVDLNRLLSSPHLRFTETVDESKAIAKLTGFHIIIAASGMCDAGRIRHHLKRWLWSSDATVLLVGFQAQGTLGRFLVTAPRPSASRARRSRSPPASAASTNIQDMPTGQSSRAGSRRADPIGRGVFLVHGEEPALAGLSERIAERIIPTAQVLPPAAGRYLRAVDGGADARST